jgi:hypothetical protein
MIDGIKKFLLPLMRVLMLLLVFSGPLPAQCSICTKTAQQLGEKPAKALNSGIVYLAAMPFMIMGYIIYRWWQSNREA